MWALLTQQVESQNASFSLVHFVQEYSQDTFCQDTFQTIGLTACPSALDYSDKCGYFLLLNFMRFF